MKPLRGLRAWMMRLVGLARRDADDARITEEMRFHLDQLAKRYERDGLSQAEARRRAAMTFGSTTAHREAGRDALGAMALERLAGNIRLGVRTLLHTPLSSLTIVATLGLCIGAATAMFATVNGVLLRALPFQEPDRLVWISSVRPDRWDAPFTLPEFMDFRELARESDVAAYTSWNAGWETSGGITRVQGMRMSANGFALLGARPSAGRLLETADDDVRAPHVVVLTHPFWMATHAGSKDVVGSPMRLNGEIYTIVGVMPEHFPWPLRGVDIVVPLVPDRDPLRHLRGSVNFLRLFGRLAAPDAMGGAERELTNVTADLRRQFPTEYATKIGVRFTPMREYFVGGYRSQLYFMLGGVALLFGVGLASVLNLLSMRAASRRTEIAVRRAIGASTGHLASQLLAEGTLLAIAGGLTGAGIASWAVSLTGFASPLNVLRFDEIRLDGQSLVVIVALSTIAAVLFSVIPLAVAMQTPAQAALLGSSRSSIGGGGQSRLRAAFVVAEVALALMLTFGMAMLADSLWRLERVDLGYQPDSVFITRVSLPAQRYRRPEELAQFVDRVHAELASDPEVVRDAMISVAPLSGLLRSVNFSVDGLPFLPTERPLANYRQISPDYFAVIRAPIVSGRSFVEQDDPSSMSVAVVSRALADRYLPAAAIGRRLLIDDNNVGPRAVTVVGVVENLRHVMLDAKPEFDIYLPLRQTHPDGVALVANNQFWVVRVATDPMRFEETFRRVLARVEPEAASSGASTLRTSVDTALAPRRVSVALVTGFAAVALVLAALGVHGVMAYAVQLQRRSIALRVALGATTRNVVGDVLRSALGLAAVGLAAGIAGALASARALEGLVFGVAPRDPVMLAVAAVVLVATTILASWIPARRAARIDPAMALRGE